MRLRPLTEAECYARCYGGQGRDRVAVVRLQTSAGRGVRTAGEELRERFLERLETPADEAEAA